MTKGMMRMAACVAAIGLGWGAPALAAPSWGYCWAKNKAQNRHIVSAPTLRDGSDSLGQMDKEWTAFARSRLGADYGNGECLWGYAEYATGGAIEFYIDAYDKGGSKVELTRWVSSLGGKREWEPAKK